MSAGVNILITAENAQALAVLQQTQGGVQKLGQAAMVANAGGIKDLQKGTVGLANGFRAMQGTLILLGGQQFPQLTLGVMAAQQAMTGLRAVAESTKISIATLGAASVAGLAGAWKIAEFIQENIALFKATNALDQSSKDLAETTAKQMATAYELAIKAVTEGRLKLSEEEAKFLDDLAARPTPERLKTMLAYIRERMPEGEYLTEAQREKAVNAEMQAVRDNWEQKITDRYYNYGAFIPTSGPRFRVENEYADILKKLEDLRERGYLDDIGLRDAKQLEYTRMQQKMIGTRAAEASEVRGDWRFTDLEKRAQLERLNQPQLDLGPDPEDWAQQFRVVMVQIQNQWGTLAQQMASSFGNVFNSAIGTISNGLTAVIMQTQTWGQFLRNIGLTILNSIVQAIVQMGVQWLMTHVIMKGISLAWHAFTSALGWAKVAETNAQEAAKTPALATNAALASAGSFGTSAIMGIAALLAVIGLAIAAATGAFAAGGRPGLGQLAMVGERGPELFVPDSAGTILPAHVTEQVSRYGGPSAGSGGRTVNQTLHIYQDRQAWLDACRDDIEGIAVNAMLRNRHRFSA